MMDMQNLIIYNTPDGRSSVALYAKDGNIWLNQLQIAELFATSKQTISHHVGNILSDNELEKDSVVKYYLTTASDGKDYNAQKTEDEDLSLFRRLRFPLISSFSKETISTST